MLSIWTRSKPPVASKKMPEFLYDLFLVNFFLLEHKISILCFDGEFSLWERAFLSYLFDGFARGFHFGELTSDGSRLFVSQILWLVFLALEELPQVLFLGLIDNCQYTGNRFAYFTSVLKVDNFFEN